jgi:hypothetical protein
MFMRGETKDEYQRDEINKALIRAAGDVDAAEVQRLIAQGADVRATDERGRTALHEVCFAIEYEEDDPDAPRPDLDIIAMLLRAGADVDAQDDEQRTPMFDAVRGDGPNLRAIRALAEAGADVDAPDVEGMTPLMTVFEGFFEPRPAALLLEMGADPLRENLEGTTAWDLAHDEVLMPGASRVRELMRAAIVARGLDVPRPRAPMTAADLRGVLDEVRADLKDGPTRMNGEEWLFTIWSAALQLLGAWLLWRWGMELPALVWAAIAPVNVALMMVSKWAMREDFITPKFWPRLLTFGSTPATFGVLLALHWYALHWIVWILLAIYIVLAISTLWLTVEARRTADSKS